jgi:hypothetical protein
MNVVYVILNNALYIYVSNITLSTPHHATSLRVLPLKMGVQDKHTVTTQMNLCYCFSNERRTHRSHIPANLYALTYLEPFSNTGSTKTMITPSSEMIITLLL